MMLMMLMITGQETLLLPATHVSCHHVSCTAEGG